MAVNQWTPIKEDNSAAVSLFDIASRSFTEVGNIVDKVWDRFNKQRQFDQEMAHKQAILDEDIRYHALENEFKLKNLREQARQHDTSLEEQSRQFAANLGLDTQKANISNLLTLAQLQENAKHYRATEEIGQQNALTSRIQTGLMAINHAGSNAVKEATAQARAITGSNKPSKNTYLADEKTKNQIRLVQAQIKKYETDDARKNIKEKDIQTTLTDLGNVFPQLGEVYRLKGDIKNLRSSTASKSSFAKIDSNPLMIKNLLESYEKAENKSEFLDQLPTYSGFSDEDMKTLKQYISMLHSHNTALNTVQKAMQQDPKIIENVNKLIKGSALGTLYGVGDDSENEYRYNLALEEKKASAKQAEQDFRHREAELERQFKAEQDEKKRTELGKQFKEKMELAYRKAGFHPEQAKALSDVFVAERYYNLRKEAYDKNPKGVEEQALLAASEKGLTEAKQKVEKLLPYQAYKALLKQDNPKSSSSNSNNDRIPPELLDKLLKGADAATLLQEGLTFNQAATTTKIKQAQENIELLKLRAQGQALRNAGLELNNRLKTIKVDTEVNKRKATKFFSNLATLAMSSDSPLRESLTNLSQKMKEGKDTAVDEAAISNTLLQLAIDNEIPIPEHMLKNNGNVFKITARYATPKGFLESVTALLGSLLGLSPDEIKVPEFFANAKTDYDKKVQESESLDKEIENKAKLWYDQDEKVKPTGGVHFPQSWFPFKSPQLGDAIIEIGARSYQLRYRQKHKKDPSESSVRNFKNIIAASLADFVPQGPNSDVFYIKGHEWDPRRFLEHLAKNRRYLSKVEFGQGIIQDMLDAFERIHGSIGDNVFTSNDTDQREKEIARMVKGTNAKELMEIERKNLQ